MRSVSIGIDNGHPADLAGTMDKWYVWARGDVQRCDGAFFMYPGWPDDESAAEAAVNLGDFLASNGVEVAYEPDEGALDRLLEKLAVMG